MCYFLFLGLNKNNYLFMYDLRILNLTVSPNFFIIFKWSLNKLLFNRIQKGTWWTDGQIMVSLFTFSFWLVNMFPASDSNCQNKIMSGRSSYFLAWFRLQIFLDIVKFIVSRMSGVHRMSTILGFFSYDLIFFRC